MAERKNINRGYMQLRGWQDAEEYYRMTRDYFSGVTLADLMDTPQGDNYVI